jgi:hypothetical protein
MNPTCQDRDLLCLEPVVYLHGGVPGQTLATATDGVLTGVTFTSPSSDFVSAGVAPGMVLCVTQTTPAEGSVLEIVDIQSSVALTVSVLRQSSEASPVAPLPATGLTFHVRTFAAQIGRAAGELVESLRRTDEATDSQLPLFADSAQLRDVVAHGALADVFVARSAAGDNADVNWIKAGHYRRRYDQLVRRLRVAVDADGDGVPEQTRSLGNVTLRRI